MKVSDARSWLLLLFLVQTNRDQVSAQCSKPTTLCCLGVDLQCKRDSCYCDQECIKYGDCCADYYQTCIQSSSSTSVSPTSPLSSSSTSTSQSSSSTSPLSSSSTSTNQPSSSTSEPPSSSSPPPTSAASSAPQQKNVNAITVFHMGVRSGANEEAVLKAMHDFIFHLEDLMRKQQCEDCRLRVLNIREKHH